MKIYLIVCLIAVFFFKQSNHQLFWLTGLALPNYARSLASEEFIVQSAPDVVKSDHVRETPSPSTDSLNLMEGSVIEAEKDKADENRQEINNHHPNDFVDVISDDKVIPVKVPEVVGEPPHVSKPKDSESIEPVIIPEEVSTDAEQLLKKEQESPSPVKEDSSSDSNESKVSNSAESQTTNEVRNVTVEPEKEKPVVPVSSHQEEEPIPSFLEWTQLQQKKLQELQSGGFGGHVNGHNGGHGTAGSSSGAGQQQSNQNGNNVVNVSVGASSSKKETQTESSSATKNFASPDCGAKVIQSNPGSQNPSGVLSSSHDEYMLNKCGIPIWFVIELCEPLKIEKVSLGNLELFSSSPKEFELGISDRFPAREWNKLGPFPLPDARSIHPLTLPATNSSTFGKFLKVNILAHHGTEHYCPLSVVTVNGKSEYEVLESETTHAEDEEQRPNGEESSLYEESLGEDINVGDAKTNEKSVFGSATDAVLNIVKKAAQVLAKSDTSTGNETLLGENSHNVSSLYVQCQTMTFCLPNMDPKSTTQIHDMLSCNSTKLFPFLKQKSTWCGWEKCHDIFRKSSIGLPWQIEGFYLNLFGGPHVLTALCHYLYPLKKPCDVYVNNKTILGSPSSLTEESEYSNLSLNVDSGSVNLSISTESETDQITNPPPVTQYDQQPAPPENTHNSAESVTTEQQQIEVPQTPVPPTNAQNFENQVDDNQNQQPTQSANQQKESVFVRLSNRIKTLERNQSLTASYLEELSRRFKKQNEDNHNLNELMKKQLNDTQEKYKYMENLLRLELQSVRRNLDDMRERLFTVQIQRSLLILICLVQFLFMIVGCLWIKRRLKRLENRYLEIRESKEQKKPLENLIISGRKRANSDVTIGTSTTKVKKIKKKKKPIGNSDSLRPQSFDFQANMTSDFADRFSPRKENINPLKLAGPSNSNLNGSQMPRPNSLNCTDSQVNLGIGSGRFSLLSSPGASEVFKSLPEANISDIPSKILNSPNTTNSFNVVSGSASSNSSGIINTGVQNMISSSSSSNGSKKAKKGGLKSLMPRIFDR